MAKKRTSGALGAQSAAADAAAATLRGEDKRKGYARFGVGVNREIYNGLAAIAEAEGIKVNGVVRVALEWYVREYQQRKDMQAELRKRITTTRIVT